MFTKIEPQPDVAGLSQKLKETKKKKDKVTKFIEILFGIFEGGQQPEIFSWTSDGSGILIHNHVEFSEKILPKYFKHNNFASFIRQLNIYGFKKIKSETCENHYSHEMFRRGHKELLCRIKRKKVAMKDQKNMLKPPDVSLEKSKPEQADRAIQENFVLKKQQKELADNLLLMNQRIEKLSAENEILTERFLTQNQQIEKLKLMVFSTRNPQNNPGLNPLLNHDLPQMAPEFAFSDVSQLTNLMRSQPQATSIQHFQVNQTPLQQQQQVLPQHQQLLANQQQQLMMRQQQQQLYEAMRLFPTEQTLVENPGMRFNLPIQGSDPGAFNNLKINPQTAFPGEHLENSSYL